ncbi:A/G-specific adenine glycosylase [Christiangramia portivictoriae]|uniref:A/G-specific adenine glycosylase n=1 Tax=Christiangramia portivictoriae TaxID=326069 RepID=UPI0004111220|nr:A/G-specific adenine glycosylase [Christiangramia portivictoriae]
MVFSKRLKQWYLQNKRDLPWRSTQDPYKIWLSEIIMQQTRVEQGLPYYLRFTEVYPNVHALANAPEQEVLKLWQGLGYYSRARNLHATAIKVSKELQGNFPDHYKELKTLKGVGDYTASAIASFCYNEPVAVVDGNVYRVLSRVFGVETPINSTTGVKEFKALAQELIDKEDPATFNQAIMEFGAIQCKPQNPLCETCPFNDICLALKNDKIKELPVKLKKTKIRHRYFNYIVPHFRHEQTILEERTGKGIWSGLYQFPLVETSKPAGEEELINTQNFQQLVDGENFLLSIYNEKEVVHKLSHQHLHTTFWNLIIDVENDETISFNELQDYPVPVLIENFLNEFLPEEYK